MGHVLVGGRAATKSSFVELLCGCLMSQDGWVTRVISVIDRKCHWTAYFKLLERFDEGMIFWILMLGGIGFLLYW